MDLLNNNNKLILHYTPTLNDSPSLLDTQDETINSKEESDIEWQEKMKKTPPEPSDLSLKFSRSPETKTKTTPKIKEEKKSIVQINFSDLPDSLDDFEETSILNLYSNKTTNILIKPKSNKPISKPILSNEYWSDEDDFETPYFTPKRSPKKSPVKTNAPKLLKSSPFKSAPLSSPKKKTNVKEEPFFSPMLIDPKLQKKSPLRSRSKEKVIDPLYDSRRIPKKEMEHLSTKVEDIEEAENTSPIKRKEPAVVFVQSPQKKVRIDTMAKKMEPDEEYMSWLKTKKNSHNNK